MNATELHPTGNATIGYYLRMEKKTFTQGQVDAIAAALGDTDEGLTGSEISHVLKLAKMTDNAPGASKAVRIQTAFAESQNARQDRLAILAFIRHAMKPERYLKAPYRYEPLRALLNGALAFAGLVCDAAGELQHGDSVKTIPEAERRARELRSDLEGRGVHLDVLRFCRSELLADNYFHATLEAVKSVADKVRKRTGLDADGAPLIDQAFGGEIPMLAINSLSTKSEKDEQKGFCNLLKGVFGMFRNPTAHEARINWPMTKADAEDLLSLVSLVHRKIDGSNMPPRR